MLDCKMFYEALQSRGVEFFAGVPDSLLKDFCGYITDTMPREANIIAANEGGAMALAAGHHLATGKIGLVYMQNSGFGNTVNPLTSLVDVDVYAIPMLLIVGWRGEPGKKDEPQHVKIGRVQEPLIQSLGIEYAVLPDTQADAEAVLDKAFTYMRDHNAPYVLLVKAGTFDKYKLKASRKVPYELSREQAIGIVANAIGPDVHVVSTTGMPSRELFEHRVKHDQDRATDFLTVGSMGHASQIALGIALARPNRAVYCLDGDGAMIMHMGGLSTIGTLAPKNFRHIVLNNGAHDSVGGQPTVAFDIDLGAIARANGYKKTFLATTEEELHATLAALVKTEGPALLEVRVKQGARADLGRPTATPRQSKEAFMKGLADKS